MVETKHHILSSVNVHQVILTQTIQRQVLNQTTANFANSGLFVDASSSKIPFQLLN